MRRASRLSETARPVATFGEGQGTHVSFTEITNVETGASHEDIVFSDSAAVGVYDGGRFFGHSSHVEFDQAPIYLGGRPSQLPIPSDGTGVR